MRAFLLLWIAVAISFVAAPAALAVNPTEGLPSFDRRTGDHASPSAKERRDRRAFLRRFGADSYITTEPTTGAVQTIGQTNGFLSAPQRGDAKAIALTWLTDHKAEFGLSTSDVSALRLASQTRSADGVTHLEWGQTTRGIASFDTAVRINVARNGQVINAGGAPVPGLSIASAKPSVTAADALQLAKQFVGAKPGLPSQVDRAKLTVFADDDGGHLAWQLTVAGQAPYVYTVVIDATSGKLLLRHSLTDSLVNADVYQNYPGAPVGGTQTTTDITGYLNSPFNLLKGPNAYVFADLNNNAPDDNDPSPTEGEFDTADAGEDIAPSGGNFQFPLTPVTAASSPLQQSCPTNVGGPCTWSGSVSDSSRALNRSERATQLFYFVNRYHDWLSQQVGFTAGDHNFEGVDPVIAQVDDGNGNDCDHLNNANMTTLPDGQEGLMQMYLFGRRSGCGNLPAVSSADDAGIVYHEYTHGLSNRLIGNGNGLNSVQSGAMGEAWSDFYASDFLVANGYEADSPASGEVVLAKYATNDPIEGIRWDPIDCAVGSSGNCNGSPSAPGGGFTYGDLGHVEPGGTSDDAQEVHSNGEIWAQTLWDIRKALGPDRARVLITDGMRMSTNIDPSFLDMRNSIIAADTATGGTALNTLWAVFAARGMGCGARTPSANSTTSVTQAFDTGSDGHCGAAAAAPIPKPAYANANKTTRLDKRGRFKFHFIGSPAGARGIVTIRTASKIKSGRSKRILSLGSHSFQVPSNGFVDMQLKLSKSTLKKLKSKKKIKTNVSIGFIGATYATTLTLTR